MKIKISFMQIPSRFFTIEKATDAAELRAIAAQRAQAFWDKDSQQCSEYAARVCHWKELAFVFNN